jgi:hypothetical protein
MFSIRFKKTTAETSVVVKFKSDINAAIAFGVECATICFKAYCISLNLEEAITLLLNEKCQNYDENEKYAFSEAFCSMYLKLCNK